MGKPAARIGDMHVCPKVTSKVPHVGGPIALGAPTVLIGGAPAARVGDMAICVGPPDKVAQGSTSVLIAGKPAARMGDRTAHGGVIVVGNPTVLIGDAGGGGGSAGGGSSSGPAKRSAGASATAGATTSEAADGKNVGAPPSGFSDTIDEGTRRALAAHDATAAGKVSRDLKGKSVDEIKVYMEEHYGDYNQGSAILSSKHNPDYTVVQTKWELPDGTVIRLKETHPTGHKVDKFRTEPSYSVSALKRDSSNRPLPDSYENEAFKVGDDGSPVPKGPADIDIPQGLSSGEAKQHVADVMSKGHRTSFRN